MSLKSLFVSIFDKGEFLMLIFGVKRLIHFNEFANQSLQIGQIAKTNTVRTFNSMERSSFP